MPTLNGFRLPHFFLITNSNRHEQSYEVQLNIAMCL